MENHSCCPPGSWDNALNSTGTLNAKGTLLNIASSSDGKDCQEEPYVSDSRTSTPVYYSPPPATSTSNKGIVVYADVYGPSLRFKCICDTLAEKGEYHVIAPDCFRGTTKEKNHFDNPADWLRSHPYDPLVADDTRNCLNFLKQKGVNTEQDIGSVGFCWGGWAIAKSASVGVPWKVGVSPHPSIHIEEKIFGSQDGDKKLLESANFPFLLLPAGNDLDYVKPDSAIVKRLEEKGGKSILFEKMVHGWTTRGDLTQESVTLGAKAALTHCLEFLKKHL